MGLFPCLGLGLRLALNLGLGLSQCLGPGFDVGL
jgi:hypothetical protein